MSHKGPEPTIALKQTMEVKSSSTQAQESPTNGFFSPSGLSAGVMEALASLSSQSETPTHAGPLAEAEAAKTAPLTSVGRAILGLELKFPGSLDARVRKALLASPAVMAARGNPRAKARFLHFRDSFTSLADGVRMANAWAKKTGDYSAETAEHSFLLAMTHPTRGGLLDLAEAYGVNIYHSYPLGARASGPPQPITEGTLRLSTREMDLYCAREALFGEIARGMKPALEHWRGVLADVALLGDSIESQDPRLANRLRVYFGGRVWGTPGSEVQRVLAYPFQYVNSKTRSAKNLNVADLHEFGMALETALRKGVSHFEKSIRKLSERSPEIAESLHLILGSTNLASDVLANACHAALRGTALWSLIDQGQANP